jgi:hypothetical protein
MRDDLAETLKAIRSLSDDDLNHARQGADFARRGYAHDKREAAKWSRVVSKFDREIKRRRALRAVAAK